MSDPDYSSWADCPLCKQYDLRIREIQANNAAALKQNQMLKNENLSLQSALEAQQRRLAPYTPDGLVAKRDVTDLFHILRTELAELRELVNSQSWKYAYDSVDRLDDTLDAFYYLADED